MTKNSKKNENKPKSNQIGGSATQKIREMQKKQDRKEKIAAQGFRVTIFVILASVLGAIIYSVLQDRNDQAGTNLPLAKIGATTKAANCGEYIFRNADGNADHRDYSESIDYEFSPPAFGPHYVQPVGMQRKFYEPADRPDVEYLVHNLEHGFTIVWYNPETITPNQKTELKQIVSKFPQKAGLDGKLIVAPWTEEDGKAFPDNKNIAYTHWLFQRGDTPGQEGVWQYCDRPSGEALNVFLEKFPFFNAPEGNTPG